MEKITSPSIFIGQEGNGIISFGSGQPDMPPPEEVYKILPEYRAFKYGLIQGQENLREALSEQYHNATADSFIITNGASEALDLSLRALYEPGGKILLPKPYYYSYPFNVKFAHMIPEYYDLVEGKIDYENLEEKIISEKQNTKGYRAIVINSPGNPTGSVQDLDVLQKIEKLTHDNGVYVISDEVYKDLIYGRENYLIKGDHVLTLNSFSKTYAMCGFRIGYVYARQKLLIDKIIGIKTHTSMNTNILGQEMAHEATTVPKEFIENQRKIWEERRDMIYDGLKKLDLDLWKPEGAFYVFPKMKNPNKVVNDLYYKYNTIVYDGAWFGDPKRVRFSYALDISKIEEGLKRLAKYLNNEYKHN